MNRAYSKIEIKSIDNEKRIIEGIASTPTTDRMGDIVEPKGMQIDLPIPLLWQHDHAQPIGQVTYAKADKNGVNIRAQLANISEPGQLKDLLDFAWQSIKANLVRGLSIGFRSIEQADIEGTWGTHYLKTELLELSAVTVPANAEASITQIKSIDQKILAASGKKVSTVVRLASSGDTEKSTKQPKDTKMKVKEQIAAFEATKAEKAERMKELMEGAAKEGRTLTAEETEEYDTLSSEIKATDDHLTRLRDMEALNLEKATPVTADVNGNSEKASEKRTVPATVQAKANLPAGAEFARFVMCVGAAKGNVQSAFSIARKRFADSPRVVNSLKLASEIGSFDIVGATKSAVGAANTIDTEWAGALTQYNQFAGDFVEFLRPQTIIGRFGTGNIPNLRRIPFNVHIRGQISGSSSQWVGQGKAKPVTSAGFNDVYLGFTKIAAISVLTEELMRFSNPAAEGLIRDELARSVIERMDTDFVDPSLGASTTNPASITNSVSAIHSSGNTAADIRNDISDAVSTYIAANIDPSSLVWIMPATVALRLQLMRNNLGQREFPDITMAGGMLEGFPVITSQYVPTVTAGSLVVLASASDIWLADDGQVSVDLSREASIEMDTQPQGDAATIVTGGTESNGVEVVSMFQTNSVAIRAERFINWKKRRTAAVAVIDQVNWGVQTS